MLVILMLLYMFASNNPFKQITKKRGKIYILKENSNRKQNRMIANNIENNKFFPRIQIYFA